MRPDELEQLLHKHHFKEVVRRGDNIMACCPAHMERRPSWGISVNEPHMHGCFACGFKGTLFTLLRYLGVSRSEALKYAEEDKHESVISLTLKRKQKAKELPMKWLYANPAPDKLLTFIYKWRGIKVKVLQDAMCGYSIEDDRILFPWFVNSKLVGITGRTLNPYEEVKIISYGPVSAKGKMLYMPKGKIKREPLILVEGEFDALKVVQSGFSNVGALAFGSFTKGLKEFVLDSPCTRVVTFFDNDKTGELLSQKVKKEIGPMKTVSRVKYSRYKDPAEMSDDMVQLVVKRALTLSL